MRTPTRRLRPSPHEPPNGEVAKSAGDRRPALARFHVGGQEPGVLVIEIGESCGVLVGYALLERLRYGVDLGNTHGSSCGLCALESCGVPIRPDPKRSAAMKPIRASRKFDLAGRAFLIKDGFKGVHDLGFCGRQERRPSPRFPGVSTVARVD